MSLQSPRVARRPQLGVDLTAVGARPGVHGALGAVAARAFDGERLARLVHRADRGRLDLVVLGDGLLLHPGRRQVAGRLDAAVAAARVAPLVRTAALVAGVPHHQVDPGHLAGAIRGVQGAAGGPAGWQVSGQAEQEAGDPDAWAVRAEEAVLAVLAAWAAAEPGAVRRDDEGRFRVDHDGIRFAVRGRTAPAPAAAPGQPAPRPLVVVPVAGPAGEALAGRYADVARLTAPDLDAAAAARARVRAAALAAGRAPDAVQVLLDVDVALADDRGAATARLDLVRSVEQPDLGVAGAVVAGTGEDLATILSAAVGDGAVDGFVVRPTSAEADLTTLVDRVVPALRPAAAPPARPAARRAPAAPRLAAPHPSGSWSAAPFALT
jgi:alkanesulfonate monooxygenase SsuD/methylene tetrahydromethanopterin reductase-like flavin-dependent oxidoreductase (luciferase family)